MDTASILLIFNVVKEAVKAGTKLYDLIERVEAGEEITLEELQLGDNEQIKLTEDFDKL